MTTRTSAWREVMLTVEWNTWRMFRCGCMTKLTASDGNWLDIIFTNKRWNDSFQQLLLLRNINSVEARKIQSHYIEHTVCAWKSSARSPLHGDQLDPNSVQRCCCDEVLHVVSSCQGFVRTSDRQWLQAVICRGLQ